MLLFIAIIVVVIGYVHLTNRISDLEKIVKSGGVSRSPQPQIAISQPQPTVAVPSQGFEPTQTFVAQTVAPISTPAPMAAPVRTESSEEAGGRWLGKLGIIAVFIGISFFLKYAFDNNLIGVVGRVMIGLFAGIILLSLGQYLRKKYRLYSDVLIGGGIGVLYLTMYAAFAFYHLIDQPLALFFIAIITIIAMVMSYIDDSPSIAIMGTIGGFLTPLLLSLDRDSVVSLFSYVLILALGVLALSLRKKWVSLQYLTFAGTIFIVFTWCASFYNDTWLGVVMTFLTLYFLIFLATTFIRHFSRKEKASGGDLTFVSLNALGYFTMSYALLKPDYDPFLGFFALILAVVYLSLAWYSYLVNPDDETMNFYLPGLAFVFVTIAIPIQFSGSWITISWLIESLIIFFLAYAVNKPKHQVFGVIAYAIGVIKLFSDYLSQYNYSEYQPFMSEKFFFFVIAIIVAYCISYIYTISPDYAVMGTERKTMLSTFIVIANLLTIYIITSEISVLYDQKIAAVVANSHADFGDTTESLRNQSNTVIAIVWTLYATLLIAIGFARRVKVLRMFGLIFFFITAFKIFIDVWSLGELYRIISSIIFGVVALAASFAYAKYKHRINDMINN